MRGATVEVDFRCGVKFLARVADRKRGWGKYCNKRCNAIHQEQRTGATARFYARKEHGVF